MAQLFCSCRDGVSVTLFSRFTLAACLVESDSPKSEPPSVLVHKCISNVDKVVTTS